MHPTALTRRVHRHVFSALRRGALLLAVGLAMQTAVAQETPQPPSHVTTAAAVIAADTNDAEVLARLVDDSGIDPWLVVEQLGIEGRADLGVILVSRVSVPERDPLLAYAESLAEEPPSTELADAWARTVEAYAARDAAAALAVEIPDGADASVAGLEAISRRVSALIGLGRFEEALEVVARLTRGVDELGWAQGTVRAKLDAAHVRLALRDLPAAVRLATEARARADQSGDLRLRAIAARSLGSYLQRAQRHLDAYDEYAICIEHAKSVGNDGWVAGNMRSQARCLSDAGRHADALARMDEALELYRALGDRKGESYCLNDGAIHMKLMGDLDGALARYEQAQAMFIELGDVASQANALNNLAAIRKTRGDLRDSLDQFAKAAAIFRELGRDEQLGNALQNIATTHAELGNHDQAIEILERVRQLRERNSNLGGKINVELYLAHAYGLASLFGQQSIHLERALALASSTQAHGTIARVTLALAKACRHDGRYDMAETQAERALEMYRQLEHRAGEAKSLQELAELHFIRDGKGGDESAIARVRERLDEAIDAAAAVRDTAAHARLLYHHGYLHHFAHEHQAAIDRLMEGIELVRSRENHDPVPTAMAWLYVGTSRERLQRFDDARAAFERVLEILDETGPNRAMVGTTQAQLALLDLREGDHAAAADRVRSATALTFQVGSGLDTVAAAYRREVYDVTLLAAIDVATQVRDPELLLSVVERGTGMVLARALGSREAIEGATVAQELLQALNLARHEQSQAAAAVQRATASKKLAKVREARAVLAEKNAALDQVSARYRREASAAASVVDPQPLTISETAAALSPGEVMIHLIPRTTGVAALLIRKSGSSVVTLDDGTELMECVDRVLLPTDPYVNEAVLPELRRRMSNPLGLREEDRTLLISPRGRMAFLPFGALFPSREVALVASATVHGLLRADRDLRGEGVLAVGDPDYGGVDSAVAAARGVERGRLAPLPGTRVEAKAVGTRVLLGQEATEANFRSALASRPRWRSIHLACHGLVDTARPQFTSLAITPGDGDDGFLSCLDLYSLATRADLAVLSACETGRGKVYVTEGVVGLAGAFMQSGTPRVICSQWKVDDEATQVLMKRFYELWNPDQPDTGVSPARALRLAQQHVREQERFAHPKFWAAWVLWGLPE